MPACPSDMRTDVSTSFLKEVESVCILGGGVLGGTALVESERRNKRKHKEGVTCSTWTLDNTKHSKRGRCIPRSFAFRRNDHVALSPALSPSLDM